MGDESLLVRDRELFLAEPHIAALSVSAGPDRGASCEGVVPSLSVTVAVDPKMPIPAAPLILPATTGSGRASRRRAS